MNTTSKKGYKFTEEFGYIPNDWEVVTLGEIGNVSMCKRIMKEETSQTGEIPFYKIGTFGGEPDAYISKEQFEMYKNKYSYPNKNDILISAAGTIGRTVIFDGKPAYFQDSNIVWLQHDNNKILNKYLYYVYKTNPWYTTTGGTIARLYNENITKATILLPPLPEQEKIAEVLSDVDSLIDKTLGLINKKKDLKTATMQKLLTPKDDWECKTLGEIANIQRGASPRPIDSPIWFEKNSVIGWTRISDLKGKYIYSTEQKLSLLGVKNSRYVPIGSLIMSICATLGRPAITKTELCIHDGFVCFYDIKINSEYVYYYLQYIQENWKNNGQTGSQANLNTDLINNTLIPLPDNQHQIATILSDMDLEIETLEKELGKYQDLKMGMMQQLLTGQVRLLS